MLVALLVTCVVAGSTLTIALSSRGMFETDQHRTTINQNLRAGMDMLGIDVRQAGERMPFDAPAVEIVNGEDGAPDTLYLRRNMLDYVLPLCKDIGEGTNADSIFVGKKKISGGGKVPQGCQPVPDENDDDWPDNLEMWREYRIANGGAIWAYIHNPVMQYGEFFLYNAEDNSTFHLHKANAQNWQHDFDVAQDCRIYMLEQRHFQLQGDILQLVINDNADNALNLVSHIQDFQIDAVFKDGTVAETFDPGDLWTDLRALQVRMVGRSEFRNRTMEREVVSRYFPRNILSN
jgi:type IV pilus assembly protein PilW